MDITPYVARLRESLTQAAASGDEHIRDAADRLALALEPSVRLTLMEALSEAGAEITSEMPSGSVEVRLSGRDLEFVVNRPAPSAPSAPSPTPGEDDDEADDGATARITLRIPQSIKTRAEELAAKHGASLNSWVVDVLRAATRENAINIDIDLSSIPFLGDDAPGGPRRGRRMTGWI